MLVVFVVIIAVVGISTYLTLVLRAVPGAVDERLGKLEPLPPHLGTWVRDVTSAHAASAAREQLVRETRVLLEEGWGPFGRQQLVEQARYRAGEGGKIVRVDPEQRRTRQRQRS